MKKPHTLSFSVPDSGTSGHRIEERHQRVNFSPSAGLFGDKNGVTFRLHPGITDTPGHQGLITVNQHPFSQLRSVVLMARPASSPGLSPPHSHRDPGFRQ